MTRNAKAGQAKTEQPHTRIPVRFTAGKEEGAAADFPVLGIAEANTAAFNIDLLSSASIARVDTDTRVV